jgi:hypothetical protein
MNNSNLNSNVPNDSKDNRLKMLKDLEQIQHVPVDTPTYDANYILMNRAIKFLLNFLLSFLFLKIIIGKYPEMSINQLILLFCAMSSILLYVLDLTYPSCSL